MTENDDINTREDAIRYLVDEGGHDEADLAELFDAALGREHPIFNGESMTTDHLVRLIDEFGFMDRNHRLGWLTPDGRMLGCDYAAHDRLLHCLGMSTHDAEQAGWARVGPHDVKSLFKFTARQRRALARLGRNIDKDAEALKPMRRLDMTEDADMKLVEGPFVDGRILPRLANGRMPEVLYRVMSRAEYDAGAENGHFVPRERIHASVEPLFGYCEPGDVNALVAIEYHDVDGWRAKHTTAHGVVAITDMPLPASNVRLVASGTRGDLEEAWENDATQPTLGH